MSIFDEFRDLADELAVDFMVPAKVFRVVGTYDRNTDKRSSHESVENCLAVMTPRRFKDENGVLTTQSVITMTIKPEIGHRIEIGCLTYIVTTVEEVAPDGNPIIWKAVVK